MKQTLKFVRGAVSTKDLVPILKHFHFYKGRVQGFNGHLCIDSPMPTDLECTVPAERFIKAVDTCKDEPEVIFDGEHELKIKSGSFTCKLPLQDHTQYPVVKSNNEDAESFDFPDGLLDILKRLKPFISTDASRPWSLGVRVYGKHIYTTNNVSLVRIPVDFEEGLDDIVFPVALIDEVLRLKDEDPIELRVSRGLNGVLTVFYSDGSWIRCSTPVGEWPNIEAPFDNINSDNLIEIPVDFLESVKQVGQFSTTGFVTLDEGYVICEDAKIKLWEDDIRTAFMITPLVICLSEADRMDITGQVTIFKGENIEMRLACATV